MCYQIYTEYVYDCMNQVREMYRGSMYVISTFSPAESINNDLY